MNFDFNNEKPIYIQIVEKLKVAIISGKYPLGSKLPSVRDLAIIAKVNPNTVQKALNELEIDKLVYTKRTNGKYVTDDKKVIEKVKEEFAKIMVNNYISNMNSIGVTFNDAIKYLREMGGKK